MSGLLTYHPGHSFLHKLDPRTKLLMPLLLCVGVFSSSSFVYLIAILALELLVSKIGGIFVQTFRVFYRLVLVMAFLFILQLLFIQQGETLITLPLGLRVTNRGVETASLVVLRLIAATLPLFIMLSLTKLNDLSASLVVHMRVPYKYAFGVTTAIRFVPEFTRDMRQIIEAQTARGMTLDTANPLRKLTMLLPLCVPLLIGSVRRIDSTAMAAELRGFNLRNAKTLRTSFRFGIPDTACTFACALLVYAGVCL